LGDFGRELRFMGFLKGRDVAAFLTKSKILLTVINRIAQ
jgi:hypothetical protein